MPSSGPLFPASDRGGGKCVSASASASAADFLISFVRSRASESEINAYLNAVLGDAPRPRWGLPAGWAAYLAELFSWALGRPIGVDQASRCARRRPGMSWEADQHELQTLGLHPAQWQLPLKLVEVNPSAVSAGAADEPVDEADDPVDAAEVLLDLSRRKAGVDDAAFALRYARCM